MNDSYGNNILNDQNFCIKYAKQEDMCGYRFSLFGLENCEIFEEAGFKKYNSPYAVYFINSLDRGILSNKLDTIKNSLEQTNTKR